jgi:hypothetical protein
MYYPNQSVPEPDPCRYKQWVNPPEPGSIVWGGNDPAHGRLWTTYCPSALSILLQGPGGTNSIIWEDRGTSYVPDGLAPGAAAPDPMSVVDRALGRLNLPAPEPTVGPDLSTVAVKVPVWLWIANAEPITVSSTAGPLTATVTARVESTTWQMGEPLDPATPGRHAAAVTCTGPGVPYSTGSDPARPPCGYTYVWQSLPQRTGGTGTWTVTVTAIWAVTWTLNTGQAGTERLSTTASLDVHVGEWHSVLVQGNR